jgi:hypothetical protein
MPFGEPGAHWLLVDRSLEHRRTPYEVHEAAARIRATAYPGAAAFADQYVLTQPSEATMLDIYSRVELR